MTRRRAIQIGLLFGVPAAALQAWVLWVWLGWGFWFLSLVVPACLVAMQMVTGSVAVALLKQFGETPEPDAQP